MKKIVIITGLTASGKSKLALDIAKKYDGEIISADSVQIYKGLNIGSAKESKKNRRLIFVNDCWCRLSADYRMYHRLSRQYLDELV